MLPEPTDESSSTDRRIAERVRVLLSGEVVVDPDGQRIPVFVRDLSDTGARLWSDAAHLPDRFTLRLPSQSLDLVCVVMWRRGLECGVHFDAPTPAP
jgi:hypothetical protein